MPYPTSTIESTITTTLVIFDSQVLDLPLLYNALLPGSIAHTIQPDRDSIDTITNLLTQTGATKLAIVAHGQPGSIQIGNGLIDRAMLETRSGLLQEWGLDSIALYSCEVGMDAEFVRRFGELTGAQISASTNKLGAGNWELDGGMELLEIDRLADYSSTLATFSGTAGNDAIDAVGFGLVPPPYISGFSDGDSLTNAMQELAYLTDGIGDSFFAGDGNDFVRAGSGDDLIVGGAGNDTLEGRVGNDTIAGEEGSNTIRGGFGNDKIIENSLQGFIDAGPDLDFLNIDTTFTQPSSNSYSVIFTGPNFGVFKINGVETGSFTNIEQLSFKGTSNPSGNDVIDASLALLSVTPQGSYLTAGLSISSDNGNDLVLGSTNGDYIDGGYGNDYLLGQGGNDDIRGNYGLDIIIGGTGVDTISGGADNDTIFGGTEGDFINGDTGEDYIYGEDGNDTIKGGYGFDVIYGQAGDDTIYGEGFNITASGLDITNPIAGFGINDTIFGGLGNDSISGGIGDDYILGEEGNDNIEGAVGNDFIYGGIDDDTIYGGDGNDYLVGQDGSDRLFGDAGIDYLEGGNGNDTLLGGDNDDYLYGNVGIDNIEGGDGNDFIDGGDGNDSLNGQAGSDVIFGLDGDDFISAGSQDNAIDFLYGGNGNDILRGHGGSDFLIGGAGSDTFEYLGMNNAGDTITDFDYTTDRLSFTYLFNIALNIPSSAVNASYIQFIQSGANTLAQVDPDGAVGGANFVTMATLNNVNASLLSVAAGNVIV